MLLRTLILLRAREISGLKSRLFAVAFSITGMLLMFGWNWAAAVSKAVAETSPARYQALAADLFGSILIAWISLGVLANLHLGWHFDLTKPLRAPVRPFRVFAAKTVCGLLGPWLLVVWPVLIAFAWRSAGPIAAPLLALACLVFAMAANSAVTIAGLLIGPLTGRFVRTVFVFFCCLLFSVGALGSIRAAVMKDSGTLTRFSQYVVSWVKFDAWPIAWAGYLSPSKPLAGLYMAARTGDRKAMFLWAMALIIFAGLLGAIEYRILRRVYLTGSPILRPRSDSGSTLLTALEFVVNRLPERARPPALLLAREIALLRDIPSVPILGLMFLCYCPVFVVFVPPPQVMMLEAMCVLPFMVFAGVKGNLLGADWLSARMLLTQPVSLERVLAAKNAALDLVLATILAATFVVGTLAGAVHLLWWEAVTALCWCATVFTVLDMIAAYCAVVFPQPLGGNRKAQLELSVAPFFLLLGAPVLVMLFSVLQYAARHAGLVWLALIGCAGFAVFAEAFRRIVFRRWLRERLAARREELFFGLTQTEAV